MGTNVVRLMRIEHRRISALAHRLDGKHRQGANLPAQLASELAAHAYATTAELLPFTESKSGTLDGRCRATVDQLTAIAAELDESEDGVSRATVERTLTALADHVAEEAEILDTLEQTTEVTRLRMLGDAFCRARDHAFKSRGDKPHRYRRPEASRAELYERARRHGIAGRSSMTRDQLAAALQDAQ
jgi:hypothetical protein